MEKKLLSALLFVFSLGFVFAGTNVSAAKILSYTPKAIQGTFYRYSGNKKWTKLSISTHRVSYTDPTVKNTLVLTPNARNAARKLAYQSFGKSHGRNYFTLYAKLSDSARSSLPENGFSLTVRKVQGKKVKVIRGYQGGYWFDYLKGIKLTHDYVGIANGKY